MTDLLSPAKQGDARPRVMIADKSPVVRSGLRDFIARDGRFEVLDAHASGTAFIAAVEAHPTDIGIIGWSSHRCSSTASPPWRADACRCPMSICRR
jgi:hypothetical protein